MSELTVILKDSDKTCRQKFLLYEIYAVSEKDEIVLKCIEEAKKSFEGEPEQIQVKIHLEVR